MATLTVQPEATADVGQLWRERYSDGYRTGRGDAHWGAAPRIDLIVMPAEVAYETGAEYVARHVAIAWQIGYTRAYVNGTRHALAGEN